MDTRYWGPSGWQLLHTIAFKSKDPDNLLSSLGDFLPCKFCRNSTKKFIKDLPYNKHNPAKWLFDIHNKVNHKLRSQCANDPKVINPGPDPVFEQVEKQYEHKTLDGVIGNEFLLSIAINFKYTPTKLKIQKLFLKHLAEAYPLFAKFVHEHPPDFRNYAEWMNKFTHISLEKALSFKSKCKKGKTCRRQNGGNKRLTLRYRQKGRLI